MEVPDVQLAGQVNNVEQLIEAFKLALRPLSCTGMYLEPPRNV